MPKIEPSVYRGQIYGTTSQINYKGHRFTITNRHICVDRSGKKQKFIRVGNATRNVINISDTHDLCLLEPNPDSSSLSLADSSAVNDEVRIVGFPRGLPKTTRKGMLIAKRTSQFRWIPGSVFGIPYDLITTIGYPGNSGSPVINVYGELVGVVFAGLRGIHTEMYAVPLSSIKGFLEETIRRNK
jgi:S1-C subfamily serine protease